MKKIHIISIGDFRLCDLAIVFANKGYQVTCSGIDIMEPTKGKLASHGLLPEQEGWFPDILDKDYDFVIPANDLDINNPELIRAKELNLMVLSLPEYIYSRFRNKSRVLIAGSLNCDAIINMMSFAFEKNNQLFDYIYNETITDKLAISFGYDARMALIQDDATYSPFLKKQINEYYRPHILVISDVNDLGGIENLNQEEKKAEVKKLIDSIERDGKFVFNQNDPILNELSQTVREDITALPFTTHPVKEDNPHCLVSRFGEFELDYTSETFLNNVNGARIACRQMGLQDKDFYDAISLYCKSI